MPQLPAQFVLLYHSLSDSVHWDLCLDLGHALATWRVLDDPASLMTASGDPPPTLRAERLGDHRRLYLDYEGPVSGDRGHVTRVDRGPWKLLDRRSTRWTFRLNGDLLTGTFVLTERNPRDNVWTLHRSTG